MSNQHLQVDTVLDCVALLCCYRLDCCWVTTSVGRPNMQCKYCVMICDQS